MKNFLASVRNAGNGIRYALATERNIRIQLLVFVLVLFAAVILKVAKSELLLILAISALLFALELTNTAIERLADKVSPQYDAQIGVVKDIMAGAVLAASVFAILIGLGIFYEPVIKIIHQ
jgi:diacylglycerol kinase